MKHGCSLEVVTRKSTVVTGDAFNGVQQSTDTVGSVEEVIEISRCKPRHLHRRRGALVRAL